MFAASLWSGWPSALAVWLVLAGPVLGAGSGIHDDLKLFSPEAIAKAQHEIADLQHRARKDLYIETMARLSDARVKRFRALRSDRDRHEFFRQLGEEQARAAKVDGVYVLLCREPAGHAVIVWPASNERVFPRGEQEKLHRLLTSIKRFDRNYDEVLLEAVGIVREAVMASLRAEAAPPLAESFHWTAALWAIAGLLLLWGAAEAIRSRIAARQGSAGAAPAGSGIGPGVMFGATAGLWLYHWLVGDRSAVLPGRMPAAPVLPQPEAPEPFAGETPGPAQEIPESDEVAVPLERPAQEEERSPSHEPV
jgi:hypothetical protein